MSFIYIFAICLDNSFHLFDKAASFYAKLLKTLGKREMELAFNLFVYEALLMRTILGQGWSWMHFVPH